jgi:hypothetical protein
MAIGLQPPALSDQLRREVLSKQCGSSSALLLAGADNPQI